MEDVNDHVPEVPAQELVLCDTDGELGSVLVVAEDKDQPPFSAPFRFAMGEDHNGNWAIEAFNGKLLQCDCSHFLFTHLIYFCQGIPFRKKKKGKVFDRETT